jgi:hypothetical protein
VNEVDSMVEQNRASKTKSRKRWRPLSAFKHRLAENFFRVRHLFGSCLAARARRKPGNKLAWGGGSPSQRNADLLWTVDVCGENEDGIENEQSEEEDDAATDEEEVGAWEP